MLSKTYNLFFSGWKPLFHFFVTTIVLSLIFDLDKDARMTLGYVWLGVGIFNFIVWRRKQRLLNQLMSGDVTSGRKVSPIIERAMRDDPDDPVSMSFEP